MAQQDWNVMTVVEATRRIDPEGNIATIAEIAAETNEFLRDAHMKQANDIFSNVEFIRNALPTISPRRINAGASKSVSRVVPKREQIMLLDTFCEIDEQLVDPFPDPKRQRWLEVKAFIEATMQEFARNVLYGSSTDVVEEIDGLTLRYNVSTEANVALVGGEGADLASLWLIEWGEGLAAICYPRGHQTVGIDDNDQGKLRITDSINNPLMAYVNQIKAQFGLSIADDRACQRLANIESDGSSNNLIATGGMHYLVRARNRLPHVGRNSVIYANRDLKSQFDIYALDKSNGFYTKEDITGQPLTVFQGTPIRMVEQQLSTETAIS